MTRFALLAIAVCAALGMIASDALAHGGQFRVPGGGVPPGMKEPSDPTPPPPPGSPPPPTTPPPTDAPPSPTTPPSSPPPVTPPSTPNTPDLGGGNRPARRGSLSFDNWIFWYAFNNAPIENLKKTLYSNITSENPLAVLGGGLGNQDAATHSIRTKVETDIIPAMRWAMDPANKLHNDIESAGYIGLAKLTREPRDIEKLKEGIHKDKDQIVIESAALSLGLLRRARARDQFSAVDLDKVRDFLFETFEGDWQPRVRAFALYGIGLLGDQPSGSGSYEGHTATVRRLFQILEAGDVKNPDLAMSVLTAIGMQPESAITPDQRDKLRDIVLKGKLGRDNIQGIVRSEAASALGRIGDVNDVDVLRRALTGRKSDRFTQCSAAIGLGKLAALLTSENRVELAKGLVGSMKKVKNTQAVNFSIISMAYIVNEDIKAGKTNVLSQSNVGDFLLKTAADGRALQRPYAALALGLVGGAIGEDALVPVNGEFRTKALAVLRDGLASTKMNKRDQAAFAVGLGIARDAKSSKDLMAIVSDKKEDREKAGYCAVALGLIGARGPEVRAAIREALVRTTDEEMKIRCATALGLIRDQGAVELLLDEIKKDVSQSVKGQLALAIAKVGDGRAVEPMVAIMKDEGEKYLTRATVTAALGVIGDMEWIPSLNRISQDINYRAMNDPRNEVTSIL